MAEQRIAHNDQLIVLLMCLHHDTIENLQPKISLYGTRIFLSTASAFRFRPGLPGIFPLLFLFTRPPLHELHQLSELVYLSKLYQCLFCSFRAFKTSVATLNGVWRMEFSAWRRSVAAVRRGINHRTEVAENVLLVCKVEAILREDSASRVELVKSAVLNKLASRFPLEGSGVWGMIIDNCSVGKGTSIWCRIFSGLKGNNPASHKPP